MQLGHEALQQQGQQHRHGNLQPRRDRPRAAALLCGHYRQHGNQALKLAAKSAAVYVSWTRHNVAEAAAARGPSRPAAGDEARVKACCGGARSASLALLCCRLKSLKRCRAGKGARWRCCRFGLSMRSLRHAFLRSNCLRTGGAQVRPRSPACDGEARPDAVATTCSGTAPLALWHGSNAASAIVGLLLLEGTAATDHDAPLTMPRVAVRVVVVSRLRTARVGAHPVSAEQGVNRGHARPRASPLHHGRSCSRRVKPPVWAQTQ
eukprot:365960-Chlamydomonas_euryale.AAC.11